MEFTSKQERRKSKNEHTHTSMNQEVIQSQVEVSTLEDKRGKDGLSKAVIHEQRFGESEGAEPFQNLGEHSRKREQQIQSLGARISSIYIPKIASLVWLEQNV